MLSKREALQMEKWRRVQDRNQGKLPLRCDNPCSSPCSCGAWHEEQRTKARVLLFTACPRACSYCCNRSEKMLSELQELDSVAKLLRYDEVVLTGGEPLLEPDLVVEVCKTLRSAPPYRKVFLYTARFDCEAVMKVLPYVDGIHFTIHENASFADIDRFHTLQSRVLNSQSGPAWPNHSFRLYIHQNNRHSVMVLPHLWQRLEVKPWMSEDDCRTPSELGEDLFILSKEALRAYV